MWIARLVAGEVGRIVIQVVIKNAQEKQQSLKRITERTVYWRKRKGAFIPMAAAQGECQTRPVAQVE
jgi:hypothetical protein